MKLLAAVLTYTDSSVDVFLAPERNSLLEKVQFLFEADEITDEEAMEYLWGGSYEFGDGTTLQVVQTKGY